MTRCAFCGARPHYQDRHTGEAVCLAHARLEVVAARRPRSQSRSPVVIRQAEPADTPQIGELTISFWDETTVDCFDRQYDLLACPAFVACEGDRVVGVASYAVEVDWRALVLVGFTLLPDYQGRGTGSALLDAVRGEAQHHGLKRIILVTCNDNLPALALYQRYGFRLTEVVPGLVARHHDKAVGGFAGIPVRDEIRLAYEIGD